MSVYEAFWKSNWRQLTPLIEDFLRNPEEGHKYYMPYLRKGNENSKGEPYLRFDRNHYDLFLKGNMPLIDFDYINQIVRLFFFNENNSEEQKWDSVFEYEKGVLKYKLQMKSQYAYMHNNDGSLYKRKDAKPGEFSGARQKGSGDRILGKAKSYQTLYPLHAMDPRFPHKVFGYNWDQYFNPAYGIVDGNGKLKRIAHNTQTANGQIPIHWFPKTADRYDMRLLSDCLKSVIYKASIKNRALFLAFLILSKNNQIQGFKLMQSNNQSNIISQANQYITNQYKKPQQQPTFDNQVQIQSHSLRDPEPINSTPEQSKETARLLNKIDNIEESKNTMNRKNNTIRLTESQLKQVIKESVKETLKEFEDLPFLHNNDNSPAPISDEEFNEIRNLNPIDNSWNILHKIGYSKWESFLNKWADTYPDEYGEFMRAQHGMIGD